MGLGPIVLPEGASAPLMIGVAAMQLLTVLALAVLGYRQRKTANGDTGALRRIERELASIDRTVAVMGARMDAMGERVDAALSDIRALASEVHSR